MYLLDVCVVAVIGRKVNMAARLMMYYPGKVTCDSETCHHSKLHKGNFVSLELKEMKGLQNVGTIREFNPSARWASMTASLLFALPWAQTACIVKLDP